MHGLYEFHFIFHIFRVKNLPHQDDPLDNLSNGTPALSAIQNTGVVKPNAEKVIVMGYRDQPLSFRKFELLFIACPNYSHLHSCFTLIQQVNCRSDLQVATSFREKNSLLHETCSKGIS